MYLPSTEPFNGSVLQHNLSLFYEYSCFAYTCGYTICMLYACTKCQPLYIPLRIKQYQTIFHLVHSYHYRSSYRTLVKQMHHLRAKHRSPQRLTIYSTKPSSLNWTRLGLLLITHWLKMRQVHRSQPVLLLRLASWLDQRFKSLGSSSTWNNNSERPTQTLLTHCGLSWMAVLVVAYIFGTKYASLQNSEFRALVAKQCT